MLERSKVKEKDARQVILTSDNNLFIIYKEHNWQCFIEISSYCQCFNIVIKSLFKTTSFNLLPRLMSSGGFVFVQHSGSQNNDILLYYLFSYWLRLEPTVNFGFSPTQFNTC